MKFTCIKIFLGGKSSSFIYVLILYPFKTKQGLSHAHKANCSSPTVSTPRVHRYRHVENPKNRLSYNKTNQTATFLTFPCSPVQVITAHANTEAVHCSYRQQEVHNSLGFSTRRSAARQKIHSKCTVQVFWYPRVQFKVRVFSAPVVTGTVPVVLYILVERRHKHGAASGLSRDRGETRLHQSLCRATA